MFSINSCSKCGYTITDPLCPKCYMKQTKAILKDLNINPMINELISAKLKTAISVETMNEITCISCKKENVTLCRYCFSILLTRILQELNFPENLMKEFEYNRSFEDISLENEIFSYEHDMLLRNKIEVYPIRTWGALVF